MENIKLLRNTREVAVSKRLLDDESLAKKIFDFEPQISSWAYKLDNHFGTKISGRQDKRFGTEGVLNLE